MNYKDGLIDFSIKGFSQTGKQLVTNGTHRHVLKNKIDNFFGPEPDIKFHRWAGSLKSSQAFAYNIFSGIAKAKFEYDMWALDKSSQHKACVDVAIEDKNGTIKMYEVKMFEFANSTGRNKIYHKPEQKKYFVHDNYKWNEQVAEKFISFIKDVIIHFDNQHVYGEGLKQLCCHLLGIINEMTIKNGKLIDRKVELYSLCFDNPFLPKVNHDIDNYKDALKQFKPHVDKFLKEINMDKQIKYYGFLPASDYIKENKELLGSENYNYVMNRYYYNLP